MTSSLDYWFDHVGVSVPDLERAIAWWDEMLGFKLDRRNHIADIPADIAVLRHGPLRVELFQAAGGVACSEDRAIPNRDVLTWGNKHISFACDDVVAASEVLRARGVDIVWVKTFAFGSNMFIRDCAGNLIEFVQRARPVEGFATL